MTYEEYLEQIASEVRSNFAYDDSVDADMVVGIMIDHFKDAEDLKKAYEKYMPKKPFPIVYPDTPEKTYWLCPVCETLVGSSSVMYGHTIYSYTKEYCSCGQHILWEENVDETI